MCVYLVIHFQGLLPKILKERRVTDKTGVILWTHTVGVAVQSFTRYSNQVSHLLVIETQIIRNVLREKF